jgi:hypothetical protein
MVSQARTKDVNPQEEEFENLKRRILSSHSE